MSLQKQLKSKKYTILLLFCFIGFLPFIRFINIRSANMGHCIFCEISAGKQPNTVIELENDEFVVFKDIKPSSKYHFLAVPKRHIESLKTLAKEDEGLSYIFVAWVKDCRMLVTAGCGKSRLKFGMQFLKNAKIDFLQSL